MGPGAEHNAWLQQSCLVVKDPNVSVPFYERHFGMRLVHRYDFEDHSTYFLEKPQEKDAAALPDAVGTPESEKYLWSIEGGTTLELWHTHGTESDPSFKVWSGNEGSDLPESAPLYRAGVTRGFGHIAFDVPDVYAASEQLERDGVKMHKRPNEGRMKGLAFALDPDGYWIEIVKRHGWDARAFGAQVSLSQTMLRVKDGPATVRFYRDVLGMELLHHFTIPGDFTNYFLKSLTKEQRALKEVGGAAWDRATLWQPCLEITHNHGTENDANFAVHTGHTDPVGFRHIGFLVDDLDACCAAMADLGVPFHKKPADEGEGESNQVAFALDPSGYRVKLIQRGCSLPDALPQPSADAASPGKRKRSGDA